MRQQIDRQLDLLNKSRSEIDLLAIPQDINEDQLRKLFAVECYKRKIDPDRTRRLLTHFKYRMKPGQLKSESDRLVAEILCDIRIADGAKAINDGYEHELKQLKATWQEKDLEHFAEVTSIQQAIDELIQN